MKTSYSFDKSDEHYIYQIDTNIVAHIESVSQSVSCLYFTEKKQNHIEKKIPIPKNLVVYTYNNSNLNKIISNPADQVYVLCWSDNYEIEYNKVPIINITSQRTWNIVTK